MKSLVYASPIDSDEALVERIAIIAGEIREMPGVFANIRHSLRQRYTTITRGVATTVSAVSIIRDAQATGAPTFFTTVQLTGFSFLKKGPEGVLIRGPLRTSLASDNYRGNTEVEVSG
ncbi:hypothetical protein TNCV_361771 [Trichonephila clavipes]|nr:hypothetical protein TNCV_361771 [Trichonephila clavipes]